MSRNTKIVVGIIGGIVAVCCLLGIIAALVLPRMFEGFAEGFDDPAAGAEVAQSIVGYDLPAGYQEQGTMNLLVMQMALITGPDEDTVIMLAEFSDFFTGNEEDMQQQMQDAFANQTGSQNANLELVSSEETTINDAAATLATYEGTDAQGNEVRQVIGVFESKDGSPAMLMIFGDLNNWDDSGINQFIDSLE
jgi:hypothetical protein